jgi:hypothetical protein
MAKTKSDPKEDINRRLEELGHDYWAVARLIQDALLDLADSQAAMAWSTPDDTTKQVFGEDVWISACFGGRCAVNGDLVDALPAVPDGYEITRQGGKIPSTEEEVETRFAVEAVARATGLPTTLVSEVAEAEGYPEVVSTTATGESDVWARIVSGAALSGSDEGGLAYPGIGKAVDALLRSMEKHGLREISAEDAYWAVTRKTDILTDCRLYHGDRPCMRKFAEALEAAAAPLGISITK